MNRTVVSFALGLALLAPTLARADKFAVVDLQRALEETEDGKKAKAKLKSDFERKQKELDEKQEEIKKMKDALDKKKNIMKPEALQKEEQELQTRFVELQQIYARLQRDLAQKEQDATRGIFAKLQAVVGKIAQTNGFDVVLERNSAVVWGKDSLDITNEVIRRYNTESGSIGPKSK
jgi:outer membrane protein